MLWKGNNALIFQWSLHGFIYLIVCRVSVQFAGRLVSRLFQHFLGLLLATGEEAQGTLPSPPSTLDVEARKPPEVRTIATYHIIVLKYCLISSFHLFVFRKDTTQNYIAYNIQYKNCTCIPSKLSGKIQQY